MCTSVMRPQIHAVAQCPIPSAVECTAKVQWPNGQILSHRASSASGFDLCHSAVRGDPVTLFTARQGLRVEVQAGSSRWYGGVLSRPLKMCDNGNVQWEVFKEGNGKAVKVEVGVAPCNPLMRVSRGRVTAQLVGAVGVGFKGEQNIWC